MNRKEKKSTEDWDRQLSELAQKLKRYQPSEELWGKIESRMMAEIKKSDVKARDKSRWFEKFSVISRYFRTVDAKWNGLRTGLTIATAIILIFFSVFFIYQRQLINQTENKDQILAQLDKDIEQTEQHYQKLINQLTKLAKQNEKNVEPHLLALYHEKLTLLDESIRVCQNALQKNNCNQAVQFALFESYREKVTTLKMIVQAKSENQFKEVS